MQERSFDEICPYIREAGLQRQDSWRSMPRRIYDHQFLYCFTGHAFLEIDNQHHHLHRGVLAIIPPDVPHRFWVNELDPGELYWFHCDFFFLEDRKWLFELYNNPETYRTLFGTPLHREHIRENPVFEGDYRLPESLAVENSDTVEYLFRSIHKAYLRHDRFWQLAAKSSFLELLEEVLRQTVGQQATAVDRSRQVAGQMKRFIADNYYREITVREICEQTGLNCEYTSKLFKKEVGMRPVEYLNRYRIGKAKRLMLEPDLSIADIAEMVGYGSASYFCSVTKRYEGRTPDNMRAALLAPAAPSDET